MGYTTMNITHREPMKTELKSYKVFTHCEEDLDYPPISLRSRQDVGGSENRRLLGNTSGTIATLTHPQQLAPSETSKLCASCLLILLPILLVVFLLFRRRWTNVKHPKPASSSIRDRSSSVD